MSYETMRGRCREMAEAAVADDPSLTLVRGWYYCPIWNRDEPHWWTKRPDGRINDPSAAQFPSAGAGIYAEFDGTFPCEYCGKEVPEAEVYAYEHHVYCSSTCFGHDIGF